MVKIKKSIKIIKVILYNEKILFFLGILRTNYR